jgi:putative nucleotidyltransferase-like protein
MSASLFSPSASTLGGRTTDSSNEFDLLCACAGVSLAPERIAHMARAAERGSDWRQLLQLAEQHGLLPLVARNLGAHAHELPTEIEQELRSAYEANARRSLWFASELGRIADYLDGKGLQAVPYKGPALAESVYGDLALRSFSDLDFLISPADFERAKQALTELGYRPSVGLSPAAERFWLRKGYEREFDSSAGKNLVELQWGVLPYFYAVDLGIDDLLARSVRTSAGVRGVWCLSPEDALLVLCLHAAKHLWTRLIWVCDIAETLRTQTIDYTLVLARAQSLGILRIIGVSFWLAEHLLRAPVPQPAKQVVAGDPEVSVLGQEFAARLAKSATYDLDSSEYFRLILRLRERKLDRRRYLWRLVWTPGAGDLAAVRLPETLFPLYRMVRLARLASKLGRM